MKTLILILILTISGMAQIVNPPKSKKITFEGVYLSVAHTAPIDKWKRFNKSDINLEVTTIFGLPKKFSFHVEIIYPIGEKPLLRLAIARRIF